MRCRFLKERKGGSGRLKNAFIQSVGSAVLHGGGARSCYEKKRAVGKGRKQALRALARRRADLIHALLANGILYDPSAQTGWRASTANPPTATWIVAGAGRAMSSYSPCGLAERESLKRNRIIGW